MPVNWISNFPAHYLRWLGEIAFALLPRGKRSIIRARVSSHRSAGQGQKWSHPHSRRLNEGSWPPRETGEFARQDEIDAFNSSIQKLNRRASRQGRQGEGHTAIRENHTLYLGPAQQRQIALRQFETLVESVTQQIAFTASLVQEDAPERVWNPSELFTRHYQEANNRPLTQKAMNQLQARTRSRLDKVRDPKRSNLKASREIRSTRIAYDARRDPNVSSGEYDFAFRSKPFLVPILSVSEFEQLIAVPALVWLKKYLGVSAADKSDNLWNSASGKWVHDWLAAIATGSAKTFTRLPEPTEIERCVPPETKRLMAHLCKAAENCRLIGGPAAAPLSFRARPRRKLGTVKDGWMATERLSTAISPLRPRERGTFVARTDRLTARA